MTEVVEKSQDSTDLRAYDKLKSELANINKDINSLIIRNEITGNLYKTIPEMGEVPWPTLNLRLNEYYGFETQTYKDSSESFYKNIYSEAKTLIQQAIPHIEQYNIDKGLQAIPQVIDKLNENDIYKQHLEYQANIAKNSQILLGTDSDYLRSINQKPLPIPTELINFAESLAIQRNLRDNLVKRLEALKNLQVKDALTKIILDKVGFNEDPKNPGNFVDPGNVEKDPWGIRFTINDRIDTNTITTNVSDVLDKQFKAKQKSQNKKEEDVETDKDTERLEVSINTDIIENSEFIRQRHWYMELLPAIKSNLPVQGGTDVPGVQPGLNFKIEHNIVKHKVPGFSPIYQPMGVESIRCTIVGCFTGADGMKLGSSNNSGTDGKSRDISLEFTGRGDKFESLTKNIQQIQGPSNIANLVQLSRAYDAFQNAQEFYNLIVAPGKELEVEINLKKNDLAKAGGSEGPFRNAVTGNPQFKALIRRMDLYYVRADRCWYILDLEVTDTTLNGNKCLNLTVNIDAPTNVLESLLEEEEQDAKLKCISDFISKGSPYVIEFNSADDRFTYSIDNRTGYGLVTDKSNSSTQLITPDKLFREVVSSNTGGQKNKSISERELYAIAINVLLNYDLPEPEEISGTNNRSNLEDIAKGKPLHTTQGGIYYWHAPTRGFYKVVGSFSGRIDPSKKLSIKEFLKLIRDTPIVKQKEFKEILSDIVKLAKEKGGGDLKFLNINGLNENSDCYKNILNNVDLVNKKVPTTENKNTSNQTANPSTNTQETTSNTNTNTNATVGTSENSASKQETDKLTQTSSKFISADTVETKLKQTNPNYNIATLGQKIVKSVLELHKGTDVSASPSLKKQFQQQGGLQPSLGVITINPIIDDNDSFYIDPNNSKLIYVKTKIQSPRKQQVLFKTPNKNVVLPETSQIMYFAIDITTDNLQIQNYLSANTILNKEE